MKQRSKLNAWNKFGAVKTLKDGHTFHSKGEAVRYQELKLLEMGNHISNLELQPRYTLVPSADLIWYGKLRAITYVGDFSYEVEKSSVIRHLGQGLATKWEYLYPDYLSIPVCEDFKGHRTPEYKLKRALFIRKHQEIYHLETSS